MRSAHAIETAWREPVEVLGAFADEPWAVGLLSDASEPRGRWSCVARAPDMTGASLDDLARAVAVRDAERAGPAPFQGGVIGLASYSLGARTQALDLPRAGAWPDLVWGRYPAVLAFDHRERRVWAIGRGEDDSAARRCAVEARAWLKTPASTAFAHALACEASSDDARAYEAAVAEVVRRIGEGEIFQANVARRWRWRLAAGARPFDLAARLAAASPAPFAAYLRLPGLALVSNSPERFVTVRPCAGGLQAETRPIKGTAPRRDDPATDAAEAKALAASAKDRAENLMIVDLMRNDLARVSVPGAVKVPQLCEVESFANVHHLVSAVTARLAPGRSALDLLASAFPPGSITGAPKVQAMKVIAALEPPGGPFFGSLFWAGVDGALDSSVLIRTAAFEQDSDGGWRGELRAGAGIVADSDPLAERLETETKASAVLAALRAAD